MQEQLVPPPRQRCIAIKTCCVTYGPNILQRFYDVVATIAETNEGGEIGNAIYLIFAYENSLRGPWGYGLVGIAALSNGVIEILHRIKPSDRLDYIPLPDNNRKCHNFWALFRHKILQGHKRFVDNYPNLHHIKYIVVNSIIGGQFVADFLQEGTPQILANSLISAALMSISIPVQIADSHGKLDSLGGKVLKHTVHSTLAAFAGLGVGSGILFIPEGFKKEVPMYGKAIIWSFFALSLVAANLVDLVNPNPNSKISKAAKIYRSAMYGAAIMSFAMLFWLDIQTEVTLSPHITDLIFGLITAGSSVQGILSGIVHYFDLEDRHHGQGHAQLHVQELNPPHSFSQNRHRLPLIAAPADDMHEEEEEVEVVDPSPNINPE